jgi:hypothetical protein
MRLLSLCNFYGRHTTLPSHKSIPPGDTSSGASLAKALGWLKHCDQRHSCRSPELPKLPKRILDVHNGRVRLHEQEQEQAEYACLSHFWGSQGSATLIRTTPENQYAFNVDIPWTSLSNTFRDAISFVRRLGLRYLWVDSLCFLQDDPVDWQEQSAEMSTYTETRTLPWLQLIRLTQMGVASPNLVHPSMMPRKHLLF